MAERIRRTQVRESVPLAPGGGPTVARALGYDEKRLYLGILQISSTTTIYYSTGATASGQLPAQLATGSQVGLCLEYFWELHRELCWNEVWLGSNGSVGNPICRVIELILIDDNPELAASVKNNPPRALLAQGDYVPVDPIAEYTRTLLRFHSRLRTR